MSASVRSQPAAAVPRINSAGLPVVSVRHIEARGPITARWHLYSRSRQQHTEAAHEEILASTDSLDAM